jgi:hypothetical protein
MISSYRLGQGLLAASLFFGAGCTPPVPTDVMSSKSAVELRAMQERTFDTTDRNKALRSTIATLQDLGYVINKIEPPAGTVSAEKDTILKLTASVFPHGANQTAVRANAMILIGGLKNTQVDDPLFYQQRFFEPLSKTIALSALPSGNEASDAKPAIGPVADAKGAAK